MVQELSGESESEGRLRDFARSESAKSNFSPFPSCPLSLLSYNSVEQVGGTRLNPSLSSYRKH